ncbi:MAG: bifunctional homocysteine S-methyltransferase/methylenetetrahydrofolate reductase [Eubacteriales bacterium]
MTIKEYLKDNILITDGAMGTYYAQIKETKHTMSEKANINDPSIINDIHTQYIESGAKLIRTNTFSANTHMLEMGIDQVLEIVRKGYRIAKTAVDMSEKEVYIAASIGPIPETGFLEDEVILQEYYDIVDEFLSQGANIFLFETFSDIKYIKKLVPYIKSKNKNSTVMAQFALNLYGYTKRGMSAKRLLSELHKIEGLDVYGFNCGIGAGHLYQILDKLHWEEDAIIAAVPNSGYPDILQDRMVYMDNPSYFVDTMIGLVKLGIQVIGGCCGTTPAHIKMLSDSLKDFKLDTIKKRIPQEIYKRQNKKTKNVFYDKLEQGKKVIAVELDPPFGKDIDKVMEGANLLKSSGVDMITIADSPMGKPRADSIIIASKINKEVNIPVMPHICCRDKNIIAMRSQLLGAYIEGIRNLLLVTGDPIPSGDRNEIKSVFNMNSIQLMQMVKEMNIEHFSDDTIFYGGALNLNRPQIDKEIERIKKKIEAGATYFLTQPIYEEEGLNRLKYIKEKLDVKILGGILPLVNIRNARFIQNEILGILIPDSIIERFDENMSREESEEIGIEIAVEIALKMGEYVDGYYYMIPFNRIHMIDKIMKRINKEGEHID